MKKYLIGYTQGTFDLFHVGHLNLLLNAKLKCKKLYVGVNSNRLVQEYKKREPIIDEKDRLEIIKALKCVDGAFVVDTLDKCKIFESLLKFDVVFIGSDWKNNKRWIRTETDLKKYGVDVLFLDYTKGISSTIIRQKI